MAGVASWAAFSARWRARQGLPLLCPLDVQYLTPQDFCNGYGRALDPTTQRRLFRQYVEAAVKQGARLPEVGRRRALPLGGELAFVRAGRFGRSFQPRRDFLYGGRSDIGPYEHEAHFPTRPYGLPVASPTFQGYWMESAPDDDEEGIWNTHGRV